MWDNGTPFFLEQDNLSSCLYPKVFHNRCPLILALLLHPPPERHAGVCVIAVCVSDCVTGSMCVLLIGGVRVMNELPLSTSTSSSSRSMGSPKGWLPALRQLLSGSLQLRLKALRRVLTTGQQQQQQSGTPRTVSTL
ncbi:hypothetical protein AALO_G00208440 [Alosa alosa]|uniref:Uncharacterized protein n=1 Tax=Alosa alosa TaxID=278164 RepID=A0AAV6G3W3_9TELE|nr:hypothetical protein AALO_G00208440 [Alosa alosa]